MVNTQNPPLLSPVSLISGTLTLCAKYVKNHTYKYKCDYLKQKD